MSPPTLGDFFRAMRTAPAFWARTVAVMFFALAAARTYGVAAVGLTLGIGMALNVLIGYPVYRRRRRMPYW